MFLEELLRIGLELHLVAHFRKSLVVVLGDQKMMPRGRDSNLASAAMRYVAASEEAAGNLAFGGRRNGLAVLVVVSLDRSWNELILQAVL